MSEQIKDLRVECPLCMNSMRHDGGKKKVHSWYCTHSTSVSVRCNGVAVMSKHRALLAKDLDLFGRYLLVTSKLEACLVMKRTGTLDRAKSFDKVVKYLETNNEELMKYRAEYLGRKM